MAARQGKLKLGKGAGAFIKRRLLWLPQVDVERDADFCPLPEYLEGRSLWLGMVVSRHEGLILAGDHRAAADRQRSCKPTGKLDGAPAHR